MDRADPRRWTSSTTTACSTACGPCRPTGRSRGGRRAPDRGRARATDHHRRRPPPLRDRAPLSRRATDGPLVRGGAGLGLDPDALPASRPASRSRSCRRTAWSLGLGDVSTDALVAAGCRELFDVEPDVRADELSPAVRGGRAGAPAATGGSGSGPAAAARSCAPAAQAFEPLPAGGRRGRCAARRDARSRRDRAARRHRPRRRSTAGARSPIRSRAAEAIERGRSRRPTAASAALLLEPTPAAEIVAVAADGDVMPQKSTYIYPKALTGLVINPLEW